MRGSPFLKGMPRTFFCCFCAVLLRAILYSLDLDAGEGAGWGCGKIEHLSIGGVWNMSYNHSMFHVAFLHKHYIDLIESGSKTIESRLTINRPLCWDIEKDDTVLFKEVGGEIRLIAKVTAVHKFDNLNSDDINVLADLFFASVGAGPEYWLSKSRSKYAVFIEIDVPQKITFPIHLTPRAVQSAWVRNFAIPDGLSLVSQ